MSQSQEQIAQFIEEYFGFLVEDKKKRERLVSTANLQVLGNTSIHGPPSLEELQETLGGILDRSRDYWLPSLQRDLTGKGFTLEDIITTGITPHDELFQQDSDLTRGNELLKTLKGILPEDEFRSFLSMTGGPENSIYLLAQTRLTTHDIVNTPNLSQTIGWLIQLTQDSKVLYLGYAGFQSGLVRINPVRSLDSASQPLMQRIISEIYQQQRTLSFKRQLRGMGFSAIINSTGGVTRLVRMTNPELLHNIPYLRKWKNGEESLDTAINAISEALYTLPGYKQAEQAGNREEQVRIVNKLIREENSLTQYFYDKGLSGLMGNLIDPSGKAGLKKSNSPKALLEFYSERKGLGWFDQNYSSFIESYGYGKLRVAHTDKVFALPL